MKIRKRIKKTYKETKRSSLIVYTVLRILVILCMVMQLIRGSLENAILCVISLILLTLPYFIQKGLKIKLPNTLEIIILLFIFSAEILGEIQNFYGIFPFWDTILHTINGFLAAAVGFSLVDLLNIKSKKIKLSPIYLCLVAFCFSMTIGVLWEFFEFGVDSLLNKDMQKDRIVDQISSVKIDPENRDNIITIKDIEYVVMYDKDKNELITIEGGILDIGLIDTMKDLIVNFIGALVFSVFGYFYLITNSKNSFLSSFIPKRLEEKEENIILKRLKPNK